MKYHRYPVVLASLEPGSKKTIIGENLTVVGHVRIPMKGDYPSDDRYWDAWSGLERSLKDGLHIVALKVEGDVHAVRAIDRIVEEE